MMSLLEGNVEILRQRILQVFGVLNKEREFYGHMNELCFKLMMISIFQTETKMEIKSEMPVYRSSGKYGFIDLFVSCEHGQLIFELKYLSVMNFFGMDYSAFEGMDWKMKNTNMEKMITKIQSLSHDEFLDTKVLAYVNGKLEPVFIREHLKQKEEEQTTTYGEGLKHVNKHKQYLKPDKPTLLVTGLLCAGNTGWKLSHLR